MKYETGPKTMNDVTFTIGYIGQDRWWTNMAAAHISGKFTNEKLMAMPDEAIERIIMANGTEMYHRPMDAKLAERQGGAPGEEYSGVHRGVFILEYRRRKRERAKFIQDDNMRNLVIQFDGTLSETEEEAIQARQKAAERADYTPVEDSGRTALAGLIRGLEAYCEAHPEAKGAAAMWDRMVDKYCARYPQAPVENQSLAVDSSPVA